MIKNSNIKKISLSTVLISMLIGCGGGGGSETTNSNSQGGVNSLSLSYDSCVDLNLNATCEESEKNLDPSLYPNVAVTSKDANAKYLLAPGGTKVVSAFSTLVYSEMMYNPLTLMNEEKAKQYVLDKLAITTQGVQSYSLNSNILSDALSAELIKSIRQAVTSNPLANKNSIIAAVCEKFLKHKSFVTISSSEVKNQIRVLTDVSINKLKTSSWQNLVNADLVGEVRDAVDVALVKEQGGEKIVDLSGNGNFLLASSQYHNALTVIDFNADSTNEIKYEKFAAFRVNYNTQKGGTINATLSGGSSSPTGSGSTGSSSSGASGASLSPTTYSVVPLVSDTKNLDPENTKSKWEHLLEQAKITSDGSSVYALIRSKDESVAFPDSVTYGFFKVEVGQNGVLQYDASTTIRIPSKDIKEFILSKSNNRVLVYGQTINDKDEKQNILRVLDGNLNFIKAVEIDNLKNFTLTQNDKYVVANIKSDYLNKAKLIKLDASTLKDKIQLELDFDADNVFTYAHSSMALLTSASKKKVVIVNLDTMKVEQEKIFDFNTKLFSVSQDGKYLVIAAEDKINIYNLSTPEITLQGSIDVDITDDKEDEKNTINKLSFIGNEIFSYSQIQAVNQVITHKIDVSDTLITPSNQIKMALNTLDKNSLNRGYSLAEITNNLTLPKSYKDINFSYRTVGLSNVINTNTGLVTAGDANISGQLIVNASMTYRGEVIENEKTFYVTVLTKVAGITPAIQNLSSLNTLNVNGAVKKMISNSNGTSVLSYTVQDGTNRGYNLFTADNDILKFTDGSSISNNQLYRDELLNITYQTNNRLIVATVNKHYPAFSSLYVQNVNYDNTLTKNYNTTNVNKYHIGNFGTPLSASFSKDKNKVIIIRKHFDFDYSDYYADVYSISGNIIKLDKSLKMKPGIDYNNTYPAALNEDGSVFYQIAANTVYKQNNKTISSLRVDNVKAVYNFNSRVFTFTNEGMIYSYDEDLNENSKKAFNVGTSINKLEYRVVNSQKQLYVFTSGNKAGLYIIKLDSNNEMSEYKFSAKEHAKGGTVSEDGLHVFTYDNLPRNYSSSNESTISYIKD